MMLAAVPNVFILDDRKHDLNFAIKLDQLSFDVPSQSVTRPEHLFISMAMVTPRGVVMCLTLMGTRIKYVSVSIFILSFFL